MSRKKRVEYDIIYNAVQNADRPAVFLERLCARERAIAGTYWSARSNPMREGTFFLKAVYGRSSFQGQEDVANFHLEDDYLLARSAFAERRVKSKVISKDKFSRHWMRKSYTQDLRVLGVKMVAVVPVLDTKGKEIAIFSLYFKNRTPLRNVAELYHSCQIQAAAIESSERANRTVMLERSKDRHETLAHVRIIARQLGKINAEMGKVSNLLPDPNLVENVFGDAARSTEVLRQSFDRGTFSERVLLRKQYAGTVELTKFLRSAASSAIPKKAIVPDIRIGTVPETTYAVEMYRDDLQILFSNLYLNAFKYAAPAATVRTRIEEDGAWLKVTLSNEVEAERQDDLKKIWEYEVRGEHAMGKNISGEGIGLGLVEDICRVYGIVCEAEYVHERHKSLTKDFAITLKLPEGIFGAGTD